MNTRTTLELTEDCKFIANRWDYCPAGVELTWVASNGPYYDDIETDVTITKEKAIEIIEFLTEAFSLGKEN